ncbi:flagellar FliJ family protein [bacterium]|nr:flagellar FliJ family protein [FCB group bacterium]MBL7191779.1 flagellar FliJ family protein [bacterium]
MPRFQFRLQKVLEAKQAFEKVKLKEAGEARRKLSLAEFNFTQAMIKRQNFQREMAVRRKQSRMVSELRSDLQYERLLTGEIKASDRIVRDAKRDLEIKTRELVQAMKERKIIEKLRERKWAEYLKESEKEELKFNDEIAAQRWNTVPQNLLAPKF